jgi:DNA-binding GntR family transcriptional regulator
MSTDFHNDPGAGAPLLLSDQAHDRIRHDILTCVFQPGAEVTEAQLAERYGLGKGPVRTALHRLTQEGFVRAVPRRGYIVTPVTVRDIHDLFEYRLVLEPATVRLAAGRLTPDTTRHLEQLCAADVANGRAFNQANTEFHVALAHVAGNRLMAEALTQLLAQIERLFILRYPPDEQEHALEEHLQIVKALHDGDGDLAAAVAVRHIDSARRKVLESVFASASVMDVRLTK